MARYTLAALTGAMLLASPVLANEPVRPSAVALTSLQPASLQIGARAGAKQNRKRSDLTTATTGFVLAGMVAAGAGIGIATSDNGHSSSP